MARRKLAPWSGPERWEKMLGGEMIWVEILPLDENRRAFRNDLGDRWTEDASELEAHRKRLLADGSMCVKLGETIRRAVGKELGQEILNAAYELGRGKTGAPIAITKLRSRVGRVLPHHRSDFDESILALFQARRLVLARQDNNAALTKDDQDDAVWLGEFPRHLVYLVES